MVLSCAAKHKCGMPNTPIEVKAFAVKKNKSPDAPDEPRHICENCRDPIHGSLCGVQFSAFLAGFKETHRLHPSANIAEADRITHICNLCVDTLNGDPEETVTDSIRPKRRRIASVKLGAPKSAISTFVESDVEINSKSDSDASASVLSLSSGSDSDSTDPSEKKTKSKKKSGDEGAKKPGKKIPAIFKPKQRKKKKKQAEKNNSQKERPSTPHVTEQAPSVVTKPSQRNSLPKNDSNATESNVIVIQDAPTPVKPFLEPGENKWRGYHLVRPKAKSSPFWQYYLVYHHDHKDKMNTAKCRFGGCTHDVNIKTGTSGLRTHIKHKHKEAWHLIHKKNAPNAPPTNLSSTVDLTRGTSTSASVSAAIPKDPNVNEITRHYSRWLTLEERKKAFLGAATFWAIDQNIPFSAFSVPSFRVMFDAFAPDADRIVPTVNPISVRDNVQLYGLFAKQATKAEARNHKGSWTGDHWTSPSGVTFTCNTFHYIENWQMCNLLLDLEVHSGSTKGTILYDQQKRILDLDAEVSFVFMGVLDTTGNMGVLSQEVRRGGSEAGYCTEHSFHLNAQLAFKDENVPGADGVMRLSRALVEFFLKSSQKLKELKDVQTALPNVYTRKAVGVLQDVITRWWSTHRMVKRLLFLRPALHMLVTNKSIESDIMPSEEQWKILEDIEKTLQVMARWQRVLEAEKFVTASLVMIAVFQIRANYVKIISDGTWEEPVRRLAQILLKDFDDRYHPVDSVSGKVRYTGMADIGFRNRYTGVHPYYVFATFFDPRTKAMLQKLMDNAQYQQLKKDILAFMLEEKKKSHVGATGDVNGPVIHELTSENEHNNPDDDDDDMFGDLENVEEVAIPTTTDEANLLNQCQVEMEAYLADKGLPLRKENNKKEYHDPLKWWKDHESKYPVVAALAEIFLCIPASSAPSERIWSRTSLVLSIKRASMDDDVASGIIFVKENVEILKKYYEEIAKGYEGALPLRFSGLPECFNMMTIEDEIDVGQDQFQ